MDLIADIFLIAGALGAGFYCIVLSRRLSRFTDLENGVGGAVEPTLARAVAFVLQIGITLDVLGGEVDGAVGPCKRLADEVVQ